MGREAVLTAISEFQHKCETTEEIGEIATHLYEAAHAFGFSYASYFSLARDRENERLKFSNYPAAFLDHYRSRRWSRCDWISRRAWRALGPFFWHDPRVRAEMTPRQVRGLIEARDFGIRDGYTVPLHAGHHVRAACFFSANHADFSPQSCKDIRALSVIAHEHVVRLLRISHAAGPTPLLSARESECLALWVKGQDDAEIAADLGISVNTVRRHFEQARLRLGVDTRREAIARAIMTGQISSL